MSGWMITCLPWYRHSEHNRLQVPNAKSQTKPYNQTRHEADNRVRGTSPCRGFGGVPQFPYPPKIEDPPQEEWGIKGFESKSCSMTGGKRWAQPTLGCGFRV